MNFAQHPSNNHVFGAPVDWDHNNLPCGALPTTVSVAYNMPEIKSYWKPTPEELELLNNGGLVTLKVIGRSMFPVSMGVEKSPTTQSAV